LRCLLDYEPEELRRHFARDGIEPFRSGQVLRWLYVRGEREFARMSDLGRTLRTRLEAGWQTRALERVEAVSAADGAEKLVLETADGGRVEAVIIPDERRRTVCVSSQIGCSLDCSFCATGRLGLMRNLTPGEIVEQVLHARDRLAERGEAPTHVVYMGMGEPLLNVGSVVRSIRILTDAAALGISPRRITVSTAGVVPRVADLAAAGGVRLAVSLHATTDAVRDELVPLNRRFPIARLLEACRAWPLLGRERLSFEYVLIRGVNDSRADARRLVRLLHGLRALVNLIPLNEHPGMRYERPEEATIDAFADILAGARLPVTVRRSRGEDVFAACGQLGAVSPGAGTSSQAVVR
jgi:23S rRNA (adenine2503-C2)-methyltransferase